jgi:hypothetical protein
MDPKQRKSETQSKYRRNNLGLSYVLYCAAKRRVERRGTGTITITNNDVFEAVEHGRCQYTGIPFETDSRHRLKPSLDRKDSTNPNYDSMGPHGNVRVVCLAVNQAFNIYSEREAFDVLFAMTCRMRRNILNMPDGKQFMDSILSKYASWNLPDYAADLEALLR